MTDQLRAKFSVWKFSIVQMLSRVAVHGLLGTVGGTPLQPQPKYFPLSLLGVRELMSRVTAPRSGALAATRR